MIDFLLDRHSARRAAGLPTVSLLVGPLGAGIATLRAWAAGRVCRMAGDSASNPTSVATQLARAAVATRDLVADVIRYLSSHTGRSPGDLADLLVAGSRYDLDQFFAAHFDRLTAGVALARRIGEASRTESGATGEQLLAGVDPLAVLAGLAELIPLGHEPAALLTPPATGDDLPWFGSAVAAAVAVASRVPKWPLALVATPVGWQQYLVRAPETRVKALIREGVVELPVAAQEQVERVLLASGIEGVPAPVREAVASGVPASFTTALAAASTAPPTATSAEADEAARSAAERFLFEFLELLPATAGRFELNADPGFRFGPRAAEVDLLARDLRIAVEIDGYYHFRDVDDYRRDRAKDWELQRHGFVVLRFLADDILPRLEDVRDRIIAAVAFRTSGRTA